MVSARMPGPLSSITMSPSWADRDLDDRRDLGLLAGVERVVDQLLRHDERPFPDACPVWFCNSRRLQNSMSRETRKGTRVNLGRCRGWVGLRNL